MAVGPQRIVDAERLEAKQRHPGMLLLFHVGDFYETFHEDAEVIAQLSDLVSGQAPFDITESDEYVEGYQVGLDPRLVSELRRPTSVDALHLTQTAAAV